MQFYIYNVNIAYRARMAYNTKLSTQIIWELEECLKEHHIFFTFYCQVHKISFESIESRENGDNIYMHLYFNKIINE